MFLRNPVLQNQSENNNIKGEKRHNKIASKEPKTKRASFTDISKTFSNVNIDSAKKPLDLKPSIRSIKPETIQEGNEENELDVKLPIKADPCPEFDFDKESGKDTMNVPDYAADIFKYFQHRQHQFKVGDYLKRQRHISGDMRASLVNWLVNVQEQFELNHETLYLAVKLCDIYLDKAKVEVRRNELQLLGGTAIFLAAKFDERVVPLIDDVLYMCEDNYTAKEITQMELLLFEAVGFDLGIPLSYRFLRRFSRVIKLDMGILTLARYILETSLMFYEFVGVKDDLMASACLLLALRMKNMGDWNAKLVKYTGGYTLEDIEPLMYSLNHMIIKRKEDYGRLKAVYNKYSHEIFFRVADTPSLQDKYLPTDPIQLPSTSNVLDEDDEVDFCHGKPLPHFHEDDFERDFEFVELEDESDEIFERIYGKPDYSIDNFDDFVIKIPVPTMNEYSSDEDDNMLFVLEA